MPAFDKIRKYVLAIGLLLAICAQVVSVNDTIQLYFLVVIIALTGVPHGSLDFFVERQSSIRNNQNLSLKTFLVKYVLSMLVYGIIWWLLPIVALIAFLVMAAFHFGEIDWPRRRDTKLDAVLYTVYGFLMIAFILTSHIRSAAPILETIVQQQIRATFWLTWGSLLFPYCALLLGLLVVSLLMLHRRLGWEKKIAYQFALQTLVLVSIIYWLPLYLSFGFYFGLWHSLISFNLIRKQMNLSNDRTGWSFMMRKAIPFTTIAWLGIFVLLVLTRTFQTEWLVLSNIFVGIAILTLPHLQVFTKIKLG